MRKIRHAIVFGAALVLFLTGLDLGLEHRSRVSARINVDEFDRQMRLLAQIITYVQEDYVDKDKVDTEKLFEGAIQGMLSELDPHSQWMKPRDYSNFQVETKGSFGGLGIRIDVVDKWLTVVQPLEETPAMRAGLRAGDKIIEIDGVSTQGITVDDAVDKLRGPEGSEVTLTIVRRTRDKRDDPWRVENKKYTMTRDEIKVTSIPPTGKTMLVDGIGYIRLLDFKQDAANELEEAIKSLSKDGELKGLILDLRYNQGGLLDVAVQIADLFIPPDMTIVSVRDRSGLNGGNEEVRKSVREAVVTCPMAVLVNHWSASASEIVAGAVQDHHRAIIVGPKGVKTFGKGSVQTVHPLLDGSGLKLTTAKYYTPSGRSIHGTGLIPDLEVDVDDMHEYQLAELRRMGIPPKEYRIEPKEGEKTEAASASVDKATEEAGPTEQSDSGNEGDTGTDTGPSPEEIFGDESESGVTESEKEEVWDMMVARAVDAIHSYQILSQASAPIR
jgi:carboxyl-terminal processing protease